MISDLCEIVSVQTKVIKNYYNILRIQENATQEEIKKSYRALVQYFHPDKNQDSAFASDYFLDIQEAYQVLSLPSARNAYDQECLMAGLTSRKTPSITPQALLKQAQRLSIDVQRMDIYRIDMPWLKSALLFMLSNQHIALLSQTGLSPLREAFVKELMLPLKLLTYPFPNQIIRSIDALVAMDEHLFEQWQTFRANQHRKYIFRKLLPWLTILATIILCISMYYYGQ